MVNVWDDMALIYELSCSLLALSNRQYFGTLDETWGLDWRILRRTINKQHEFR